MKRSIVFSLTLNLINLTLIGVANASTPLTYSARIPAQRQQSCAQQAGQIASQLAKGLNAQIAAEPSCVEVTIKDSQQTYKLRSIVISYEPSSNPPYTRLYQAFYSNDKYSMELNGSTGIYSSYAACLSEIDLRTKEYSRWTGLETITAGCYPESFGVSSPSKTKYAMRVDGYGQPQRRLQLLPLTSYLGQSGNQNLAAQTAALLNRLGEVAVVQVTDGLLYYGTTNYFSMFAELGFMANRQQCEVQQEVLNNLYASQNVAFTPATCTEITLFDKKFTNLQIIGVGKKVPSTRGYNSQPYYSFEECMAMATIKNKNPDRATASFCVQTVRPVQENYSNESYTLTDLSLL